MIDSRDESPGVDSGERDLRSGEAETTPPVDFAQDEDVSRSFQRAVREALAGHARRGNKVAVWKDGRPVWIRPKAGGA